MHLIWTYLSLTADDPQDNNFLFKKPIAVSFEDALSTVTVKIYLRPQSRRQFSKPFAMYSPLCDVTGTNEIIFLLSFQSESM